MGVEGLAKKEGRMKGDQKMSVLKGETQAAGNSFKYFGKRALWNMVENGKIWRKG